MALLEIKKYPINLKKKPLSRNIDAQTQLIDDRRTMKCAHVGLQRADRDRQCALLTSV
jgi:hypothetical protein